MNVKLALKLYPNKRGKAEPIDTLSSPRRVDNVLHDAWASWEGLRSFRDQAERNEMYTFGNQLGDKVKVDGKVMTEEQAIIKNHQTPLRFNLISGILKSIVGIFSSSKTEPVCYTRNKDSQGKGDVMTNTMQYNHQLNQMWELDRAQLKSLLCTGVGMYRVTFGLKHQIEDVWTESVDYKDMFFDNHIKDPRHWDCHLIGQIHDMGLYDVMAAFGRGDRDRYQRIKSLYSYISEMTVSDIENLNGEYAKNISFFTPTDETRCRVIEVWRKESKERLLVHDRLNGELNLVELSDEQNIIDENMRRTDEWMAAGVAPEDIQSKLMTYENTIDNYWYYYFLTPTGDVLDEGESPYWHKSHPYSFKIAPFYNGRVYPFIGDFLDSNRILNRTIMMQDLVMKHAAKGVLMFPEECKPDDMSMDDIAEEWAAYDGVIYYSPKPGVPAPQQILVNTTQTGNFEMVSLMLKMIQDTSGIQGALQGQAPKAGTPASLYMQQVQNSQTVLTDIFESFKMLRENRDKKIMRLIQQFYDTERYMNLGGREGKEIVYNPKDIRYAELEMNIEESASTPLARMINSEFLMNLLNGQMITLEEMLKVGQFPFTDKLLEILKQRNQNPSNPQEGTVPPELLQQIQQMQQQQGTGSMPDPQSNMVQ